MRCVSGDTAFARDYSLPQSKWVKGRVRETVGRALYNVKLPSAGSVKGARELMLHAARESCELHSRISSAAMEALAEAEAP
ncbi:hypothetical protein EVAR_2665_1 [Eumeta japonica]|uniref:Uncharacterized protein n=1 Tax=Eumeta variegata TaxID=151549 RepID=A0A4C1SMP6_EUMVA|nr:hypothetical protein EVAR_2665_1 [Eumeta japonica]